MEKLILGLKNSTEEYKMLSPLGCYTYIMVGATLRLLQFENLLFGVPQWGGAMTDVLKKGTVATVAVARGDSNPAEESFWVRLGFALGSLWGADPERRKSEPTANLHRCGFKC